MIESVLNNLQSYCVLQGDTREVLRKMPDESVHCIVTSPPYWGLRDYEISPTIWGGEASCLHAFTVEVMDKSRAKKGDTNSTLDGRGMRQVLSGRFESRTAFCSKCGSWRGKLGLEPTIEMYIDHMVEIFREARRVLRSDGVLWLNLGDTFAANRSYHVPDSKHRDVGNSLSRSIPSGLKPKDLCMVPARVAISLQQDGWYLRSDCIWEKGQPMPESVRDRPTRSHEYVFLLSKSEHYFYDQIAMQEPSSLNTQSRGNGVGQKAKVAGQNSRAYKDRDPMHRVKQNASFSAAVSQVVPFRNRRSVWRISTEPYKGPHYATFPTELPRICLFAAPHVKGCCPDCGIPWERVVRRSFVGDWHTDPDLKRQGVARNIRTAKYATRHPQSAGRRMLDNVTAAREATGQHDHFLQPPQTIGWRPSCRCYDDRYLSCYQTARKIRKAYQRARSGDWKRRVTRWIGKDDWPRVPAIVLDPFNGAGTTGVVARRMGMRYIGIEMNPADVSRSIDRIRDDAPIFNDPIPTSADQKDRQTGLFEETAK